MCGGNKKVANSHLPNHVLLLPTVTGGSLKSSSFEIRSKFSSVDSGGFTVDCPAVILKLKTTTTTGEGQERLGQDNSSSSSSSFYVPPEKLDDLIHSKSTSSFSSSEL